MRGLIARCSSSSSPTTHLLRVAARSPVASSSSLARTATTSASVGSGVRSATTSASITSGARRPTLELAGRPHHRRATTTTTTTTTMAASSSPSSSAVDWAALGLTPNPGEDVAVLGGGCFWCIEAAYNKMRGVSSAISGYAGGTVERPTYEEVCGKKTGHAEVVAVYFDPAQVSYETILNVFYSLHDPTTPNQQGNDVGPQYRSAIYTIGEGQRRAAEKVMHEVAEAKIWGAKPLTTELAPLRPDNGRFWAAEAIHQRYFEHSPGNPYCQFVVAPKVAKFRSKFADLLK